MSQRGGYVRDMLKRDTFLPLLYTSTLDLENDVPTPTSRQEVLKSFIQGAPPEVQILVLFLYILNKKNNRKRLPLKKTIGCRSFFYCPTRFYIEMLRTRMGVAHPHCDKKKKKSFWPSRYWSQMMWEALAFFNLLHKCSSKFSPFLRAKLCCCRDCVRKAS